MIAQYKVEGMTCGHCVTAVSQEIGALAGVLGVQVDLADGVVTVESGRALDDSEVDAAVDEAGYKLAGKL